MNTKYTGERVRIRPFSSEEEYSGLQEMLHVEPNDHWGAWWHPRAKTKKDFEETGMLSVDKHSVFAIESLESGELVGLEEYGGVNAGRCCGWLGTFITREHWHKGFGIEAKLLCFCHVFENFAVERVEADTLENHTRAASGLVRCGMKFEGRISKYHFIDGKFYDVVCYRIFRKEWETMDYRHKVKRGA